MAYTIRHGEIGFDVLKDNKIIRVNVPTRALAQIEITNETKHDQLIETARERVRKLFAVLREDFSISQFELEQILVAEGFILDHTERF